MTLPDFATLSTPVLVQPQCQFCRFWLAGDDGDFGECKSEGFADKVFSKWDEGSPIMTAYDFQEPEFFEEAG